MTRQQRQAVKRDIRRRKECAHNHPARREPRMSQATVILFRTSGKYYTEEHWEIPEDAIGPYDMERSLDFRRIGGGPVLVESQEPWGYPHLFPGEPSKPELSVPCETMES